AHSSFHPMTTTAAQPGLRSLTDTLPGVVILPKYEGPAVSPAVVHYQQLLRQNQEQPRRGPSIVKVSSRRRDVVRSGRALEGASSGRSTATSRRCRVSPSLQSSSAPSQAASRGSSSSGSSAKATIRHSEEHQEHDDSGKAALSRKSREELRRIAGIPTVNDFPYQCCEGWKARAPMRPAQYSFNPIRHTVDKFVIDEATGDMRQYKTKRTTSYLEPSACDAVTFNRRKGVVEWGDLQRLTNPRWSRAYHRDFTKNSRIFHRITGPMCKVYDIAARNKEPNPLRPSEKITWKRLMAFLNPSRLEHPHISQRLALFALYGPSDEEGFLRGGYLGRHKVADFEIDRMARECYETELIRMLNRPKDTLTVIVAELMPKALDVQYTEKDVKELLACITRDPDGYMQFSDLQPVIINDFHRRLREVIERSHSPATTGNDGLPFQSAQASRLTAVCRKKKLLPNQEFEVLSSKLHRGSTLIAPLEEQNKSESLSANVQLIRGLGPTHDRWDRYCAIRQGAVLTGHNRRLVKLHAP
ncbi:hypothetical protein FOZ63_033540, partial [Perkinsus olseni]